MRIALLMTLPLLVPVVAVSQAPSAQFHQGRALYAEVCAACHGDDGRGGQGYANPIWGKGSQIGKFGTAQGLFEYHQLLMPFDDPTRVPDEQKWAVTLYVLVSHGAVGADATLGPGNAGSLRIH